MLGPLASWLRWSIGSVSRRRAGRRVSLWRTC